MNFVIVEPVFATQFRIIGTVTKTFDFKLGVKSNALYWLFFAIGIAQYVVD